MTKKIMKYFVFHFQRFGVEYIPISEGEEYFRKYLNHIGVTDSPSWHMILDLSFRMGNVMLLDDQFRVSDYWVQENTGMHVINSERDRLSDIR